MTIGNLSVLFSPLLDWQVIPAKPLRIHSLSTLYATADPENMVLLKSAEARHRLDMICLQR